MRAFFTLSLITALALALSIPAQGQVDYDTVADLADLMDNGNQSDIEIDCMDAVPFSEGGGVGHPTFIFYNEATGDLLGHDPQALVGSRTFLIADSATLDAELGADVTDCRALTVTQSGDIYAGLAVNSVDYVYHVTVGGIGTVLAEADGITGIAVADTPLAANGGFPPINLSLVEFFGAPEDGFYELVESTGPFPLETAVIGTDADLDLYDINRDPIFGFLTSNSSEFGAGQLQNVMVGFSPIIQQFGLILEPFNDGTFTNGSDGGLEDLEYIYPCGDPFVCSPVIYLFNNSFSATDGEQWAAYYDSTGGNTILTRFAEETPMLSDPDVTINGYDAPDGTHMVALDDGTIYVASISAFGGGDAILAFYGAPLPVDMEATVATPGTHLLSAVYPNPFNPQAFFDLAVAQPQHVSVELYNLLGQHVATLFNARMEADATQTFTIGGADLATGSYVVRVVGERFAESRRVTLLK